MPSESRHHTIAKKLRDTFKSRRNATLQPDHLRGLAVVESRIRAGVRPVVAVKQAVEAALEQLENDGSPHAELLWQRWHGSGMEEVAKETNQSSSNLYQKETLAFTALADVLLHQEMALQTQRAAKVRQNLPPAPYAHLVGIDARIAELMPHFQHSEAPWLVALVGMGGVGKTTLAYALTSGLLESAQFDNVAWVSAQHVALSLDGTMAYVSDKPALTLETLVGELGRQLMGHQPETWRLPAFEKERIVATHLATTRTLVVVDNLETAADADSLIPFLRRGRGLSKIILTSRYTPMHAGDIFNYPVPLLSEEESRELIQMEARHRNLPTLVNCSPATAERIYRATGGNPLALQLVVGQIHLHGLDPVLSELRNANGTGALLYRYLYDWVWETLEPEHRIVMRALTLLTGENSTIPAIEELTDLSPVVITRVLQQLVMQNLVMLGGTLERRHYTLHNLTQAYLDDLNRG